MSAQEIQARPVTVTFQATGNLRLVRVPVRKLQVNMQHVMSEGLDYIFEPDGPGGSGGKLIVNDALIERDREFFERNDPKFPQDGSGDPLTLEWLRNHGLFGERFREIPQEPPDPAEILTMVTAATARGDEDALVAIYEDEDRTFKRPQILKPIEAALQGIEEQRALAAQPPEGADVGAGAQPGGTIRPPQREE